MQLDQSFSLLEPLYIYPQDASTILNKLEELVQKCIANGWLPNKRSAKKIIFGKFLAKMAALKYKEERDMDMENLCKMEEIYEDQEEADFSFQFGHHNGNPKISYCHREHVNQEVLAQKGKSKRGRKVKNKEAEIYLIDWMVNQSRLVFTRKEVLQIYRGALSETNPGGKFKGTIYHKTFFDRIFKRHEKTCFVILPKHEKKVKNLIFKEAPKLTMEEALDDLMLIKHEEISSYQRQEEQQLMMFETPPVYGNDSPERHLTIDDILEQE